MTKGQKIRLSCLIVAVIAVIAVVPTVAWLTATSDPVVNTFEGGKISLTLDEESVDNEGHKTDGPRVEENNYTYLPGAVLDKDPTVTVKGGSVESYVYVCVDNGLPAEYFSIDYSEDWIPVDTQGDMTVYRYKDKVDASEGDVVLTPVFQHVTVSGELDGEMIDELGAKNITVVSYAIQTANIELADADQMAKDHFFNS